MVKPLSLKRNMFLNTCGSMTRLVCNWLLTVAVVRFSHGFDAAGVLSLSMSVCNMVQPFAEYRLRTIHVTDVKGERSTKEYLGLRLITTGISFVLGLGYSLVTCSISAVPVIGVYLVSQLIATYIEGFHAIDQRGMRMDYIGVSYALQGICGLVLFCISLALTNSLLIAVSSIALVNLFVGLFWDVPKTRQFGAIRPVVDVSVALRTLLELFPIVLATVCCSAVVTVPRQYLAAELGTAALGVYSSVASPTTVVQVGAQYVYTPLLGTFAERLSREKHSALALFIRVTGGILVVGLVCLALFGVLGGFALEIVFGSETAAHADLLLPAVACTLVTGYSLFLNDLLISVRDYRASLIGNASATVASLLLAMPMVNLFGMNGVSYCGILGYGFGTVVMLGLLARDYQNL